MVGEAKYTPGGFKGMVRTARLLSTKYNSASKTQQQARMVYHRLLPPGFPTAFKLFCRLFPDWCVARPGVGDRVDAAGGARAPLSRVWGEAEAEYSNTSKRARSPVRYSVYSTVCASSTVHARGAGSLPVSMRCLACSPPPNTMLEYSEVSTEPTMPL